MSICGDCPLAIRFDFPVRPLWHGWSHPLNALALALDVYNDNEAVWVPAQVLSLGDRPRIDTGVNVTDTSLLEAPMPDAPVRATILEGRAVILTGASVDGYDAATHDGSGGWIDERDLSR
jgi:hypothetical protein